MEEGVAIEPRVKVSTSSKDSEKSDKVDRRKTDKSEKDDNSEKRKENGGKEIVEPKAKRKIWAIFEPGYRAASSPP